MPQIIADKTIFSLFEVARSIKKTIAQRYSQSYWIAAEMNKLNFYRHSGHCYPDLVEKREEKVIAEMRSIIWKGDYQRINQQFEAITKEPLKDGIRILFQASISFDELYGISLRIIDIDPNFSLGLLVREKQESMDRLRKEKIFDLNKHIPFPQLPKRIAIISVETSKGLADFLKILNENVCHYRFEHSLFPALLQGEKAVGSIIEQLKKITEHRARFDVVTIIRGGGGDVGLSCYNHYALASTIARFPIPVLTGIGHATNETVSEMVAYKNAITPTGLAEFLIQHFHNFSVPVIEAEHLLQKKAREVIEKGKTDLSQSLRQFRQASQHLIKENRTLVHHHTQQLNVYSFQLLKQQNNSLEQTKRQISMLHPENILKRGFSITYIDGKAILNANELQEGQEISTVLANGEVTSIIKATKIKSDEHRT